ncbi:hypothetical protein P3T76_008580 [Phytophthora citrophthora]|uniref:Uncharacterized protein n=1 Tax=Phytophthora citrophthora TaxID=4793 RepID=A0AAD9GJE3_9STRA|nr:hypothetical protein P3T76_008580 [Phytophthora citrophthora]
MIDESHPLQVAPHPMEVAPAMPGAPRWQPDQLVAMSIAELGAMLGALAQDCVQAIPAMQIANGVVLELDGNSVASALSNLGAMPVVELATILSHSLLLWRPTPHLKLNHRKFSCLHVIGSR